MLRELGYEVSTKSFVFDEGGDTVPAPQPVQRPVDASAMGARHVSDTAEATCKLRSLCLGLAR